MLREDRQRRLKMRLQGLDGGAPKSADAKHLPEGGKAEDEAAFH